MSSEKYDDVIYYLKKIGVPYETSDSNDIYENDYVHQQYSSILLKHHGIHRIINIKFNQ